MSSSEMQLARAQQRQRRSAAGWMAGWTLAGLLGASIPFLAPNAIVPPPIRVGRDIIFVLVGAYLVRQLLRRQSADKARTFLLVAQFLSFDRLFTMAYIESQVWSYLDPFLFAEQLVCCVFGVHAINRLFVKSPKVADVFR